MILPSIGLRDLVLFPNTHRTVPIGRPESISAVTEAIEAQCLMFFSAYSEADSTLASIGVIGNVRAMQRTDHWLLQVSVLSRAKLLNVKAATPHYRCEIEKMDVNAKKDPALWQALKSALSSYIDRQSKENPQIVQAQESLANFVAVSRVNPQYSMAAEDYERLQSLAMDPKVFLTGIPFVKMGMTQAGSLSELVDGVCMRLNTSVEELQAYLELDINARASKIIARLS